MHQFRRLLGIAFVCILISCFPRGREIGNDVSLGAFQDDKDTKQPSDVKTGSESQDQRSDSGSDPTDSHDTDSTGDCPDDCTSIGKHTIATCGEEGRCLRRCQSGWVDADGDWSSLEEVPQSSNGCEFECTETNGGTEICDGKDNDCDGQVDEDFKTGSCTVGTGACRKEGKYECVDDQSAECSVEPSSPSDELCGDDIDNDCDGQVDEDDAADATTWYIDCDKDGFAQSTDGAVTSCTKPPVSRLGCPGQWIKQRPTGPQTTDCNDACASCKPTGSEICDGRDNNCDGTIDGADAPSARRWYKDSDGDGYGNPEKTQKACSKPGEDYVFRGQDCDDDCSNCYPGAPELCDDKDNNCNGQVDEIYPDLGESCTSGEGACQATGQIVCASNNQSTECSVQTGSSQSELCDGIDNDCDGQIDEDFSDLGTDCTVGTGACQNTGQIVCNESGSGTTCNVEPLSPSNEICGDGIDNDCDGDIDEASASDAQTWYRDADGDGYGDPSNQKTQCSKPSGYVSNADDCNDSCVDCYPGADELCDNLDNDCDGDIDETAPTWYIDSDGDGYGTTTQTKTQCGQPNGYVKNKDDCNDNCSSCHPGAEEVCDDRDNDCDGAIDEEATDADTWYIDADGDEYGSNSQTQTQCDQPTGYVDNDLDCNDNCENCNPSATEICNGKDNDCDGTIDDGFNNLGNPCTVGTGACQNSGQYICNDDGTATTCSVDPHSSSTEICDGIDNDCDGQIDESSASDSQTWYRDADGDGYGTLSETKTQCSQPDGYVLDHSDCNDNCAACNPGETEVCDGKDNDCDGNIDESDAQNATTWYVDCDDDGYAADTSGSTQACSKPSDPPSGCSISGDWTSTRPSSQSDCDDSDASLYQPSTWYADCDGDGYAPANPTTQQFCGEPQTTPSSCSSGGEWIETAPGSNPDCNDQVKEAHPGQSQYFENPQSPAPPSGSAWDYNCDGQATKKYPVTGNNCYSDETQLKICPPLGGEGQYWTHSTPNCGNQGELQTCSACNPNRTWCNSGECTKDGEAETTTQSCQ